MGSYPYGSVWITVDELQNALADPDGLCITHCSRILLCAQCPPTPRIQSIGDNVLELVVKFHQDVHGKRRSCNEKVFLKEQAVMWIRIRPVPKLFAS
jgi:hypothetical protein